MLVDWESAVGPRLSLACRLSRRESGCLGMMQGRAKPPSSAHRKCEGTQLHTLCLFLHPPVSPQADWLELLPQSCGVAWPTPRWQAAAEQKCGGRT